ncbi:MAG: hypothetical protein ACRENH_12175, partial [Gemmatimonadaceae bacterium]
MPATVRDRRTHAGIIAACRAQFAELQLTYVADREHVVYTLRSSSVPIEHVEVSVFVVPTDAPESDGTYEWNQTTLVLVHVSAGGQRGLGYTYADSATGRLAADLLGDVVRTRDAMDVRGTWNAMTHAVRNLGRPGIASMAISAIDVALWDLKARLLDLPLVRLLGAVRESVPVYGSG